MDASIYFFITSIFVVLFVTNQFITIKRENPILPQRKDSIDAFEDLFKRYYVPLVVYAGKYVQGVDIAREIVQDFFVKLYEKRASINIDVSVKSYLYRSIYNCCMNYINQKNIQEKHLKNIDQERIVEDNLENEMNSVELQYKISEVVESLPAKCKLIFKLNRMEGLKNDEIASQLNLSKRTVETQISKALKILRKKLAPYIPENKTLSGL
jgi:RNA polymerase sigma-70 factor (family 1)